MTNIHQNDMNERIMKFLKVIDDIVQGLDQGNDHHHIGNHLNLVIIIGLEVLLLIVIIHHHIINHHHLLIDVQIVLKKVLTVDHQNHIENSLFMSF